MVIPLLISSINLSVSFPVRDFIKEAKKTSQYLQSMDNNGDEIDGKDEVLCPIDMNFMRDDLIYEILINPIKDNSKVSMRVILDCCHSGTGIDLPYKYSLIYRKSELVTNNNENIEANIIMLSGCKDNQTSSEVEINNKSRGLMTWTFNKIIKQYGKNITCHDLLILIRNMLLSNCFDQIPQLTSSKPLTSVSKFLL